MKKLLLALCLTALGASCRTSGASMHDTSCSGADCSDCTEAQMAECSECTGATECQADPDCKADTECKSGDAAVCPVTGKSLN